MSYSKTTITGDTIFIVIDGLALLLTLFRVIFRWRIRRFWWEDAWAVVVFITGTVFVATQYVSTETFSHNMALIASWITSAVASISECAVRMSILYSIIRIMSPKTYIRTFSRIFALFLLFSTTASIIVKYCICTANPSTKQNAPPFKCVRPTAWIIFQITSDCISDAILVALPLKLLWRVKLPRRQRRMILSLFSSSAIVSIFSLIHGVFQVLIQDAQLKYMDAFTLSYNLENASAFVVCNLLVVVTYLYKMIHKARRGTSSADDSSEDAVDDFTTPARGTTEHLTTVDLSLDVSYSHNSGNHSYVSSLRPYFTDTDKSGTTHAGSLN